MHIMTAIDAIVFDLGGVLVDWNPRYLYRDHFPDPAALEGFLAETGLLALNIEFDRGLPMQPALTALARRFPAHVTAIMAWRSQWPRMMAGPIGGSVALLEDLAKIGMPLYALTNWSAETFPYARDRFAFLQHFRAIAVSGELGMIKPDAAIFAHMARLGGLDPARALFIDDSAANVAAAAALGWQVHRFTDAADLRAALHPRVPGLAP